MAEHRFYLADSSLGAASVGDTLDLESETAHRISRVLRLGSGERIRLFGEGREFECELVELRSRVKVRLIEELPKEHQSLSLTLYQALIRPNRFEWLIEKVTELGATGIVPVVSDYTTVRAGEIGEERLRRWRRIAVEATEQCGRRTPPRAKIARCRRRCARTGKRPPRLRLGGSAGRRAAETAESNPRPGTLIIRGTRRRLERA